MKNEPTFVITETKYKLCRAALKASRYFSVSAAFNAKSYIIGGIINLPTAVAQGSVYNQCQISLLIDKRRENLLPMILNYYNKHKHKLTNAFIFLE